jgi:hypothetical protein
MSTRAESAAPRRHHRLLWATLVAAAGYGVVRAGRWQRSWGATAAEAGGELPGDGLIAIPRYEATRGIGIDAPPEKVWPWLVQMGADKAGFYSLEKLERAFGVNLTNADVIDPAWQDLAVGDKVTLADGLWLRVAELVPDSALVLRGEDSGRPMPFDFTWQFVLQPEGQTGSRLLVRERYAWTRWWVGPAVHLTGWVSFHMTQAMLRGIRRRAEG